jgi:isoquinoline 1-oxidoreductase alpha subunit
MSQVTLNINGEEHTLEVTPELPLLWALRDILNLTGTKYGCGIGLCGSCTVLIDGEATRSCTLPAAAVEGMQITTIEGLAPDGDHPVQRAWNEEDVAQCGYCQGGQVLAATALLNSNPNPDDSAIDDALGGNICRCGTYPRIRKAVKLAAKYTREAGGGS